MMKDFHGGLCDPDGQTVRASGIDLELPKVLDTCWPVPTPMFEYSDVWVCHVWVWGAETSLRGGTLPFAIPEEKQVY